MKSIKSKSYIQLSKELIGKNVRFKSDCELFPNFDIKCKVLNASIIGTELVFKTKTQSGKLITVGSNMKNLQYEIIS